VRGTEDREQQQLLYLYVVQFFLIILLLNEKGGSSIEERLACQHSFVPARRRLFPFDPSKEATKPGIMASNGDSLSLSLNSSRRRPSRTRAMYFGDKKGRMNEEFSTGWGGSISNSSGVNSMGRYIKDKK